MNDIHVRVATVEVAGIKLEAKIPRATENKGLSHEEKGFLEMINNLQEPLVQSLFFFHGIKFISIENINLAALEVIASYRKLPEKIPERLVHLEVKGIKLNAGLYLPPKLNSSLQEAKVAKIQRILCSCPIDKASKLLSSHKWSCLLVQTRIENIYFSNNIKYKPKTALRLVVDNT
jgi:hypothetical protein